MAYATETTDVAIERGRDREQEYGSITLKGADGTAHPTTISPPLTKRTIKRGIERRRIKADTRAEIAVLKRDSRIDVEASTASASAASSASATAESTPSAAAIASSGSTSSTGRSQTMKAPRFIDTSTKAKMWEMFEDECRDDVGATFGSEKVAESGAGGETGEGAVSSTTPPSISTPTCVYDRVADRSTCDACGHAVRMMPEGFYACANSTCGRLFKDRLEHSAEWRYYGDSGNSATDPTRCGMPTNPLLEEASFGCSVSMRGASSYEMCKIRRYAEWQSMPYKEKAQYTEFELIKSIAMNAGIPKLIIDEAMRVHKRISEQKTFRGLNRDGIIAASIYIACRIHNYPRTAREIATIFHLDSTSATKGCKNATTIINQMEIEVGDEEKTILHTTSPADFIQRYCSRLSFNEELTKVAQFVCMQVERRKIIPENTPQSVAAGIIYYIVDKCGLSISKTDIRSISDISEVTINKCYKKLDTYMEPLIPSAIIKKYNPSD